jgi:hypothetical protein
MHKACSVPVRRAVSSVMGEIVGGYRPADGSQPPAFPIARGLRWLVGSKQVFPAERTSTVLPGEQAQVEAVQRGFHLPPPFGPVAEVGIVG